VKLKNVFVDRVIESFGVNSSERSLGIECAKFFVSYFVENGLSLVEPIVNFNINNNITILT